MDVTPNQNEIDRFLSIICGNAEKGIIAFWTKKDKRSRFVNINDFNKSTGLLSKLSLHDDVYFSVGLIEKAPARGRGTEKDVIAIPGLWMDIDIKQGQHSQKNLPSKDDAYHWIKTLPLQPSMVVFSGGGFHVYWLFKEFWYFDDDRQRKQARHLSHRFQHTIRCKAEDQHGWKLDQTDDLIRLLRVAGTYNHKGAPMKVEIIETADYRYHPDDFEPYLLDESFSSPSRKFASSVDNHLFNLVEKCHFLKHCRDDAANLTEIEWYCMISALALEGGGRPLIHALSEPYPRYSPKETERKIKNAQDRQSGPMTCSTIRNKTGFHCPENECDVTSPVFLIRKSRKVTGKKSEFCELSGRPVENKSDSNHRLVANKGEGSEKSPDIEELEYREWKLWPELDDTAFHGFTRHFVEAATENSEADPAAVLITFLVRFGVECSAKPVFYVGDTKHYARLFAVIVGASSKARKGTSGSPVKRLYNFNSTIFEGKDLKPIQSARSSSGSLSSGEGLIDVVHDEKGKWQIDNETHQKEWVIIEPGVEDKRLFVLDEEFGSALSAMERNGNTLSAILRCAWDHGDIEPLTKTNKIKATGAHIGIVTHVTLWELSKKLDKTEAFSGFANRFLWCCSRRRKLEPFPKPINNLASMQKELSRIMTSIRDVDTTVFDEKARDVWLEIYPDLSKDHPGLVGAIVNRGEAQVIRLSMIYALLNGKGIIEPAHVNAARAVWKYCKDSAEFIFSGKELNPFVERIKKLLITKGRISATDIYKHFSRHITKEQFDDAITELLSRNEITQSVIKTGGRPKTVFEHCEDQKSKKIDWKF